MKIAILTQPICNNYGGILQNYALQTLLERRGHTVITLNYPVFVRYSGSRLRHILSICKRAMQRLTGHPEIVWIDIATELRKQVELSHIQKAFLDKRLHLITIQSPITWEQVDGMGVDAFVVGSDQVWRPRYNTGHLSNLFLDFAKGRNVKRYAFAASLGTDVWEYDASQTVQCAALAKQFDAISVREASGVTLCHNYLGVEASHVLDPTLMLEAEDYLCLCYGNEYPQGNYIAVYILDYTKKMMALLNEVSCQLNTPLHFIGRFTKKGYPGIESWLEGIVHAKYVITDSFHGTVFSIIFQKQFVTLGNAIRGNSRFSSLFTTLGITEDRQCRDVSTTVRQLKEEIDYNAINKKRVEMQVLSTQFLTDSGL